MGNWNKQKCHVTYAWNLQFLRNVIYKKLYQSFSGVADVCYLGLLSLLTMSVPETCRVH
jgi:hypothetical protein